MMRSEVFVDEVCASECAIGRADKIPMTQTNVKGVNAFITILLPKQGTRQLTSYSPSVFAGIPAGTNQVALPSSFVTTTVANRRAARDHEIGVLSEGHPTPDQSSARASHPLGSHKTFPANLAP